ncbi:phage tail family protein [Bacillus sp. ISL-7]|nr:phage tail family protein [Bacillus sp. ISL-7]
MEFDKTQKQMRIREFVAFLFDQKGKPREIKLSFDYEPEKYYFVKVSNGFSPQRVFGFAFFDLQFTAFDPYAYAEQTYKDTGIVTGIQYDSGYSYDSDYYYENPTSFQWVYSSHYSGVYSYSFMEIPFIVEINGTVMNPTITNQTTGETIILPTITNQKLTLDCKKFTVKVNDVNKLSQYYGDFINLVSGDNSLLFTGGSPNATVTYKWKHKFI